MQIISNFGYSFPVYSGLAEAQLSITEPGTLWCGEISSMGLDSWPRQIAFMSGGTIRTFTQGDSRRDDEDELVYVDYVRTSSTGLVQTVRVFND